MFKMNSGGFLFDFQTCTCCNLRNKRFIDLWPIFFWNEKEELKIHATAAQTYIQNRTRQTVHLQVSWFCSKESLAYWRPFSSSRSYWSRKVCHMLRCCRARHHLHSSVELSCPPALISNLKFTTCSQWVWECVYRRVNATSACRNKTLQQPAVAQWKVTAALQGPVLVLPNI